ncbi:MAG: O-antigen ligase family protein [Kiritimatiellales bacterium]
MKPFEKITIGFIVITLAAAFSLFGVWEDKATICAPLLILLYLAASVWLVRCLKNRSIGTLVAPPGGTPLLLFWFYSAALIPFSVLPYEAKISTLHLGCYLGVYWASANILSRFSYRKAVLSAVFVLLVLVALYSLVQHKINPEMLFGRLRYTNYGERLGGTYICPNHIAHLFQMWLPFCLVFLFLPQFGWFWRICFAYALPLFLLLIYQTQSRAGILGAVAAIGTTALLMVLRKSRRAFCLALLVVPLLGAVALGGLWTGSSMFRTRMQPVVKVLSAAVAGDWESVVSVDFRPQTWLDTTGMIKDRPTFGFGPGNYGLTFEDYRTRFQARRVETVHPHNEYLELLAEYGLIGGVLVLCVLISVSVQMIRFIKTAERPYHALPAVALLGTLAGTAVHGSFDFELHIFPNALMLALLAGCAVAPLIQTTPAKHPKCNAGIQWIFAVTVILASLWALQVMSSAWIRVWGDRFLPEQKLQRVESFYKAAERIDPQNWQAQLGLGQVYYHHRYYELDPSRKHEWALKEYAAYAAAYRTNTKKEEVVYGLGRGELFLGNRDKGLDYLRQAANYKRFNDFYWRKLGIELRKAGLYEEALKAFEYALKLDGSNGTVKRNIEWLKERQAEAGRQKSEIK